MHLIFFETTEVVKTTWDVWAPVVTQIVATAGIIFGGAEYWKWKQMKLQAKRDAESKESGVEKQVGDLTEGFQNLNSKMDTLAEDVHTLKKDLELLQKANEETLKYRQARDSADKETLQARQAIIESLKGLMRERLLDVYNKCVKKGFYSKEEREVYKPLYECYTSDPFHGNGVMKDLHHIMVRLPMSSDGEPMPDED